MPINRVKAAIEEIKKGNMVIMIDDEDRENEGDLVYAATFSTPDKVNFCASKAKGLICVAVTKEIATRLNLNPMVANNDSSYETAFTVSVDAKECETGISTYERDLTIHLLADYTSHASDLVRPGHIFPLIAKDGGTLVRTGHTEGSVDICKLAGIAPSSVICEIMKEDGTMARRDDLEIFAKEHDLKIVYISDIVEYRMQNESLIRVIGESKTAFLGEEAKRVDFIDHNESHHIAYQFKNSGQGQNVRFHHIGTDLELLSKNRHQSILNSVEIMKDEGGVLVFLEKTANENPYMKEYGIGAQILSYLGFSDITLLVTSKHKEFVGISGFGLNVVAEREL
ncbi:MAG: bifunctional 3,4-dihydroxy-2-butanone 4-phosphate synthase/GTP cyclohydrolase II [Epsilonproteobacteria bacterium]|nr:bifunctional 3,4-dihydroxy-2-butanone 4-phosphate synthase/GTP cyclohydrolase II [Campylobacterota bacterium]